MFRIEIRASSALCLASLMYSLRRSSVNCGSTTRMILPSMVGFTPRSESRMPSRCAPSRLVEGRHDHHPRLRAAKDANWFSGVGAP